MRINGFFIFPSIQLPLVNNPQVAHCKMLVGPFCVKEIQFKLKKSNQDTKQQYIIIT